MSQETEAAKEKAAAGEQPRAEAKPDKEAGSSQFAAILVRGTISMRHDMKETIDSLRLRQKNACVLIKNTPEMRGMLLKVKDYITWGEIDADTMKLLKESPRGVGDKNNPVFRLSPPRKGYGRAGIKKPYSRGGALGYRGKDINDIIKRMI